MTVRKPMRQSLRRCKSTADQTRAVSRITIDTTRRPLIGSFFQEGALQEGSVKRLLSRYGEPEE
jgi:hypothetical protein